MSSVPLRIKPPMGHDNAWWWEQAASDVLAIQRCKNCGELRHPPRPMCSECHSLDWDFIEAGGEGVIASYTVLHHPKFPGYDYPLIIILVDLKEGTRMTAELKGCSVNDVDFGMPVKAFIFEDPDGFKLPMFRLANKELNIPEEGGVK